MLMIGLTSQSLSILDKCLVQILGHGGCYDRGRAMLLYVKCLVADSHKFDENQRKDVILDCAKLLNKVKDDFKKVEAYSRMKDVLFLQVCIFLITIYYIGIFMFTVDTFKYSIFSFCLLQINRILNIFFYKACKSR